MRFLLNAADCISFTQLEESLLFHAHLNVLGKDELCSPHLEGKICLDSNVSMVCTGTFCFPPVLSSDTGTGMVTRCLQTDGFALKQSWGQQGEDPRKGGSPNCSNLPLLLVCRFFVDFLFLFLKLSHSNIHKVDFTVRTTGKISRTTC